MCTRFVQKFISIFFERYKAGVGMVMAEKVITILLYALMDDLLVFIENVDISLMPFIRTESCH